MEDVRKFRLDIEEFPWIFNLDSRGIAMFDLVLTFLAFIFLQRYLIQFIPGKHPQIVYYLSIVPIGIISHLIAKQIFNVPHTFLNSKLFGTADINIYKVIVLLMIIGIVLAVTL